MSKSCFIRVLVCEVYEGDCVSESEKEVVPTRVGKLEKYEWTDMWWDEPEKRGRRVLLVGDSITRGYYAALKRRMPENIYIDRYVTSRALDNPSFIYNTFSPFFLIVI